ncbi:hypothetical protein AT727_02525 [Desulfitobacterium hafniense]|uniref:MobA-like NTP transferase domain-containing protein n=1 Tax=Desulfitobacterium hafniense TaxID=49338 RepID=A0A0W1JQ03_DESHA|nr:NTP transferase domain-containing protein [Desulfitobacterium hafniense]KTE93850.1 hypothetical protein AT727_02525 [Desulfitobacterium hafniense]
MSAAKTIIISCAGSGTRLGLGSTKALVDIKGKPLIIRQLELLDDYDDIRVVVGYQAQKVIEVVRKYRDDILFVFNHEYKTTGTAASVCYAAKYANEYIVSLDGDLLVHPADLKLFLSQNEECIGVCNPTTNEPVFISTFMKDDRVYASSFSREHGDLEWTGLVQVKTERLPFGTAHLYQILEPLLPMPIFTIRAREIDTMNDYENAIKWVVNGYE